jgi:RNA polymerase sigma factor (sigma-70 family)
MLLAVWRALPSFRGDASLKTYVASIAQKRAITHVSRHARAPVTSEVSENIVAGEPLPDEAAIASDKRRRLLAALRTLSVAQRETATLMLEGFSFAEIAAALGISANAAMLRCQRAKAALVERMRELDGR